MSDRVDELKEQAGRIRAAVLARHGLTPDDPPPDDPDRARLEEVARLARVTAHWGIASDAPLVGPLLVLWRRGLRIMLRWYINPIVEQQNAFNQAVSRALFDLHAANEELRARLHAARATNGTGAGEYSDPA